MYVAGQGQFETDRGASIKEFTKKIKELFVMRDTQSDPVKEGLFVITREDQLIEEIGQDLKKFPEEIIDWYKKQHIERMYTAGDAAKNTADHRTRVLDKIGQLKPLKVSTLNVSALYPEETADDLKRMYAKMFEDAYTQKKGTPIRTVSDYQKNIEAWKRETFWEEFENRTSGSG